MKQNYICFQPENNMFGVERSNNILEGKLQIQQVFLKVKNSFKVLLVQIAGFTHVLAGFTQNLKHRLFPANTCNQIQQLASRKKSLRSLGVSKYCLQLTTMSKGLETFVAFDWGLGDTASLYTLNAGLNALSCPHT